MSLFKRGTIWWYRFRFNGQTFCSSTKSTSKTVATDAQFARRRELEKSYSSIQDKPKLPPLFSKAAKEWLDARKPAVSAGTAVKYGAALAHLKKHLGAKLICDITSKDVTAYQQKRTAEEAAPATVNTEVVCLGSILRDHNLWQAIGKNVSLLEESESGGRALAAEEERALLTAASNIGRKQGKWSPVYTATMLGLNTGMRHSEIRSLRWSQVDLQSRVLVVGKSKTKAGSGRAVPLNQPAWAALDVWASRFPKRQPEHFVFPACENGRINFERPIKNWRTAWRRATADAKLDGLGFHSLRHSAATKLLENGVPFAVVATILGWSASTAVRMAKRYGHIRPEVQRNALEGIATAAPGSIFPEGSGKSGYSADSRAKIGNA